MNNEHFEVDNLQLELQKELEKEMELTFEKEKLEETKETIRKETLSYISKRKEITEHIINYRQDIADEFKFDEDKVTEYFDHEIFVKEEAFKYMDRRLKELTILSGSPYFGKVEFDEFGENENIYIGRFGLTREYDLEPVVVDWRAPISAIFYAGRLGKVEYSVPNGEAKVNVLSKRQFIIKKGKLRGMFDSALDVKDEILQMVLSKNAGEKMKDIIMTIQEEQDRLIRFPRNKTLIVNGVAGSGKTTIALHRIAFLLYNYRNILQDKVLIIGPNSIFIDYISEVLPSLGEVGVKHTTFKEFALDQIPQTEVADLKEIFENIIKDDDVIKNTVVYKSSIEYIKELDDLLKILEKNIFDFQDVVYNNKILINRSEIEELFDNYFKEMPLFKRSKKVKRIIYSKIKDEVADRVLKIQKAFEDKIKKMTPEELEQEGNNLEFKRRNDIRDAISEAMIVKKQLLRWIRNPEVVDIYNKFNNNEPLNYNDLAPILYLKLKLEGVKYSREIKHVVIDEAQDYSILQFMVIRELTRCNSFTIVGDINQRILPEEGKTSMLQLHSIFDDLEVEYFNLNTSYRSTKEIMEFANNFIHNEEIIPLVRSGEKVLDVVSRDEDNLIDLIIEHIDKFTEEGFESIAVICSNLQESERIGMLLRNKINIKIIDNEEIMYKTGKVVIPSYFAKGLEFDAVVMADNLSDESTKLKYIMATRALHKLVRIKY